MKKSVLYCWLFHLFVWSLAGAQDEKVLVIVNSSVYAGLEPEILRYTDDISKEYKVSLFEISGGSTQELKEFIKAREDSLAGCILIGNMPVYYFEIEQDEAAYNSYTTFPCDLYFMDLDGSWSDDDNDGLDDTHTGNVAPEIFLSRINAGYMSTGYAEEISYLRNFFNRDHQYWTGSYDLRKTGLAYTDVDWKDYSPVNEEMQYLYGAENFQLIKDDRISGKDYLQNRLLNNQYEFVQVAVHSNAQAHGFSLKDGLSREDIRKAQLKALGYNLFACSACDYSQPCLGNAYIFSESEKSLAVIGSTKIGSMLEFYAFYQPLGQNKTIGQAYREWFNWIAPFNSVEMAWYYGMTLLGDPLIRFNSGTPNHGPLADIGGNEDIQWPDNTTTVSAIIKDDGLPLPAIINSSWEKVSGPGFIAFDSINSVSTAVHFSDPGVYTIKFKANDGQYVSEDFKNISLSRIKWQGEVGAFGQQNAIAIHDSIAFVLTSNELHIIDIANKSSPTIIQSYDFPEVLESSQINSLDVDSNFAYLAQGDLGLRIINVSDLHDPYEVSAFQTHDTSERENAVKVAGDLAYITDNEKGLMILDIHDRTNPVLTGFCPTEGPALALSVQDNYAYIADGSNGLRIIDISDKYHPVEEGYFATNFKEGNIRQSLQVLGNHAYLSHADNWNGEYFISIIDISDKANPVEVSRLEGSIFNGLYVEGNYLYYSALASYGSELFGIYDITDKTNPRFVDSYKMGNIYFQDIRNIMAENGYVYLLDNVMFNGLNIFGVQLDNTEPLAYTGEDNRTCKNNLILQGTAFDDHLPSGSALSFSWEQVSGPADAEFIAPLDRTTPVIFPDSGNYVLRLSVSDGDLTAHDDIRVICLNKPPAGHNAEVCEGLPVPDLTAYGDSIHWYGNIWLTDSLGSGDHYSSGKTLPGSYIYYITQKISGCESRPDSVHLTIKPLPPAPWTDDLTICEKDTKPFLVARGDSITWYRDSFLLDLVCRGDTLMPTESGPGKYCYYATQSVAGCEGAIVASVLSINSLPEISLGKDTTITQDQVIILNPDAGNCSFLWNDGSESPVFEFRGEDMDPGIHQISVRVTDSNTCENSDTLSIWVMPVTGNTVNKDHLKVRFYPNPTYGLLHIKFQDNLNEDILVILLDQKGSLVNSKKIKTGNLSNTFSLDLSNLTPGIYYIQLFTPGEHLMGKILLK